MRIRLPISFTVLAGLLAASPPAYAHHGASMFDLAHSISVKGTVTSVEWANPHAMIYVDVKDDKGSIQKWAVETRGGPNVLTRAGWNKDSLKPGDMITLFGHPAKDGSKSMGLEKIVLANGKELDPQPHSLF